MNALLAISDKWISLNALWKIVVLGLICGAGLPAIFVIGRARCHRRGDQVAPLGADVQRIEKHLRDRGWELEPARDH